MSPIGCIMLFIVMTIACLCEDHCQSRETPEYKSIGLGTLCYAPLPKEAYHYSPDY